MKKLLYICTALFITLFSLFQIASAQTILFPSRGGTGIGSATAGEVGYCLKVSDDTPFAYVLGACGTGGGGSSGGTWSTTTSTVSGQLINYPNNATDIVTIGSNATTTAEMFFDPNNLKSYIKGFLGIGTTSPGTSLGVMGKGVFADDITTSRYVATSTATSTFVGGIQSSILNTTSTTASSTFANGINLTGGCFAFNGVCFRDTTATTTLLADTNTFSTSATTTFNNGIKGGLLNITSTTASSTFANGINLTGGCFSINGSCVTGGGGGSGASTTLLADVNTFSTSATTTFSGKIDALRGTFATLRVSGLVSCDTIDTDQYGNMFCGSDSTGAGGAVTGNGIAGMMSAWSSASNLIATSTIIGERFIATSTTATSTINNVLKIGTYVGVGVDLYGGAYPHYTNTYRKNNFIADFAKDIDDYVSVNIANPNAGTSASADLTFNNDTSFDTDGDGFVNYYADCGLNSSVYDVVIYGKQNIPNMFYCYNSDGPVSIASATSTGYINFLTGGFDGEVMRLTASGSLGIGSTSPNSRLTVTNPGSDPVAWFEDEALDATPVVITNIGRLGIGTTTPFTNFTVNGDTAFNSFNAFSKTATSTVLNALGVGGSTQDATFTVKGIGGKVVQFFTSAGTKILDIANDGIVTILGAWNAGEATSFEIPNSASPTYGAGGVLALDTTSNNLTLATSTTGHVVVASATTTLYAFNIASTSPEAISGGIIYLPDNPLGQVVTGVSCFVDGGTSQVINISNDAGTYDSNSVTCDTTRKQHAITTNSSYSAYGGIRLEMGTKTGSWDYVVIRIQGYRISN